MENSYSSVFKFSFSPQEFTSWFNPVSVVKNPVQNGIRNGWSPMTSYQAITGTTLPIKVYVLPISISTILLCFQKAGSQNHQVNKFCFSQSVGSRWDNAERFSVRFPWSPGFSYGQFPGNKAGSMVKLTRVDWTCLAITTNSFIGKLSWTTNSKQPSSGGSLARNKRVYLSAESIGLIWRDFESVKQGKHHCRQW